MVAGAEVIHLNIPVLDVQFRCISKEIEEIVELAPATSPIIYRQVVPVEIVMASELELRISDAAQNELDPEICHFIPIIRSGSFADIGPRRDMEDEHIRVDDLSAHFGSIFSCPSTSSFYGIFDGHGGPDAAAYVKSNAIRLFFEDSEFPQASEASAVFIESVKNSIRRAFLLADLALFGDRTISSSSGTTALAALIFGRILLVANAGDCRAVLCRKGKAMDMSQDHRPIHPAERKRVEKCGGYVEDGYLNGMLSVSRALGDWDIKLPGGSPSPLISDPEFMHLTLMEDDEFLIIGCDGIWDVMSSQHAVNVVRRELRRHDDPERCARELSMEALRLNTFDNLTVIVVCFSKGQCDSTPRLRGRSLSTEALCNLRSLLERDYGLIKNMGR